MRNDFNPYQHIQDNKELRPFNDKDKADGNWNYIHETNVFILAEEIVRLRKILDNNNIKW